MEKAKPALMLALMEGLKKKGKMDDSSSLPSKEEGDEEGSSRQHLVDISKDLIKAIVDKDEQAVADLLEEAFECLDSSSEDEEGEEDKEPSKSSRY